MTQEKLDKRLFAGVRARWKGFWAKRRARSQNEASTSGDASVDAVATANLPFDSSTHGDARSDHPPTQSVQVSPLDQSGCTESLSSDSLLSKGEVQTPMVLGLWGQAAELLDPVEREQLNALTISIKEITSGPKPESCDSIQLVLDTALKLNEAEGMNPWQAVRFTLSQPESLAQSRWVERTKRNCRGSTRSSTQQPTSRRLGTP